MRKCNAFRAAMVNAVGWMLSVVSLSPHMPCMPVFTPQTGDGPVLKRCLFRDRMGGLCWEFPEQSERRRYMCQFCAVSGPQSTTFCQLIQVETRTCACIRVALTCWLIKTMPMSFRSWVNRSKADSMAAVSVLLSTTRKFFWASAPAVTCCE